MSNPLSPDYDYMKGFNPQIREPGRPVVVIGDYGFFAVNANETVKIIRSDEVLVADISVAERGDLIVTLTPGRQRSGHVL